MTTLARTALSALLLSAALVAVPHQASAGSGTVVFGPGEGTSVADGRIMCVMGTSEEGKGIVMCSSPSIYRALWAGTPCDEMIGYGCSVDGRLRAVRLSDRGAPRRAWIEGVGGVIDVRRGQGIKAGKITGKRLSTGGFRFANASDRGFKVTNAAYVGR